MGLPLDELGTTYPSRTEVIDPDRAVAYADATNDPNEAYRSGIYAPRSPPLPTWEAMASPWPTSCPPRR